MEREEKIKTLLDNGFTCNIETGEVFGKFGKKITNKNKAGYIMLRVNNNIKLRAHHFIWYVANNEITTDDIDHINGDRSDNRICNLRNISHHKNTFNIKNVKGYSFHKKSNKWSASIKFNYKNIHLGLFDDENGAKQAYLEAKKIYHII